MENVIITKTKNEISPRSLKTLEFTGGNRRFAGHDDHNTRQPLNNFKIAFGNCCSGNETFNAKFRGCPPLPFNLNNCLKKNGLQIINNTS